MFTLGYFVRFFEVNLWRIPSVRFSFDKNREQYSESDKVIIPASSSLSVTYLLRPALLVIDDMIEQKLLFS